MWTNTDSAKSAEHNLWPQCSEAGAEAKISRVSGVTCGQSESSKQQKHICQKQGASVRIARLRPTASYDDPWADPDKSDAL